MGRERYKRKREFLLEQTKEYQRKNRAKISVYQRNWQLENRDRVLRLRRKRQRERRQIDPAYAIRLNLSSQLAHILKGTQKHASTLRLMNCSLIKFQGYLEKRFEPSIANNHHNGYTAEMRWSNRQRWHMDHKVPCSKFDLTRAIDQHICFWHRNLRPMWAKANMEKHNKCKESDKQQLIKDWIFYNI